MLNQRRLFQRHFTCNRSEYRVTCVWFSFQVAISIRHIVYLSLNTLVVCLYSVCFSSSLSRCCARAQRKSVLTYSVSHSLCTLFICIGPVQWIYKSRKSAQHLNARTLINHQRHTHTHSSVQYRNKNNSPHGFTHNENGMERDGKKDEIGNMNAYGVERTAIQTALSEWCYGNSHNNWLIHNRETRLKHHQN